MHYMCIENHKQYSRITLIDERCKVLKSGGVAKYHNELGKFLGDK